mmetsp:Transcript_30142/g.76179  ORF Transcript_30142/g.76179 Transcript_30142/m.76179 type:complete len:237 (+) Transcript_30142:1434-2144(+)
MTGTSMVVVGAPMTRPPMVAAMAAATAEGESATLGRHRQPRTTNEHQRVRVAGISSSTRRSTVPRTMMLVHRAWTLEAPRIGSAKTAISAIPTVESPPRRDLAPCQAATTLTHAMMASSHRLSSSAASRAARGVDNSVVVSQPPPPQPHIQPLHPLVAALLVVQQQRLLPSTAMGGAENALPVASAEPSLGLQPTTRVDERHRRPATAATVYAHWVPSCRRLVARQTRCPSAVSTL